MAGFVLYNNVLCTLQLTVTSISQLFESVSFVDDSLPEQTEVTRGIINTAR